MENLHNYDVSVSRSSLLSKTTCEKRKRGEGTRQRFRGVQDIQVQNRGVQGIQVSRLNGLKIRAARGYGRLNMPHWT